METATNSICMSVFVFNFDLEFIAVAIGCFSFLDLEQTTPCSSLVSSEQHKPSSFSFLSNRMFLLLRHRGEDAVFSVHQQIHHP